MKAKNKFLLETDFGTLVASVCDEDGDSPSIDIVLVKAGETKRIPLASVQCLQGGNAEHCFVTHVWGDANEECPTEDIYHGGLFLEPKGSGDPKAEIGYEIFAELCDAYTLKQNLGKGAITLNGDRTSNVCVIARGEKNPRNEVIVWLSEVGVGSKCLPEYQHYSFHVDDRVAGKHSVFSSEELTDESLLACFQRVLDSLKL